MPQKKEEAVKATPKKKAKSTILKVPKDNHYGTGKRKTSIARVWIFPGSGKIQVNGKELSEHFGRHIHEVTIKKPFEKLSMSDKYDIKTTVIGGGLTGQASAIQLGVSRALLELNETFRKSLKEEGLLTRDPRVKERKKYGRKRARKGYQFRKR